MYYVYLIQSLSVRGERYVGITTDLKRRFQEHNQAKSSHTTKFGPWKLITYIAFSNQAKGRSLRALSQIRFRSCIREKAPMPISSPALQPAMGCGKIIIR